MDGPKKDAGLTLEDVTNWWETEIVDIAPGSIRIRGYAIEDLIGRISFPAMIWLVLPKSTVPLVTDNVDVGLKLLLTPNARTPPNTRVGPV